MHARTMFNLKFLPDKHNSVSQRYAGPLFREELKHVETSGFLLHISDICRYLDRNPLKKPISELIQPDHKPTSRGTPAFRFKRQTKASWPQQQKTVWAVVFQKAAAQTTKSPTSNSRKSSFLPSPKTCCHSSVVTTVEGCLFFPPFDEMVQPSVVIARFAIYVWVKTYSVSTKYLLVVFGTWLIRRPCKGHRICRVPKIESWNRCRIFKWSPAEM